MTRERAAQESTRQTRRVLLRQMLVLLGCAAAGKPAFAQEKTSAETEANDPFKKEAAFGVTVSVEAYYVTLLEAIKQITQSNFPFALHVAPFDAETPLHLCVKNKPLGEVLQTCAVLLNGQWREEKAADGSQKRSYVLEPQPDTVAREKALYMAILDLNAEPLAQTSRLVVRHNTNYWQKEYQKVKTVSPALGEPSMDKRLAQYLARPDKQGHGFFGVFAGLSRTQRRTLTENGFLVLPWSAMNAVQQQNALVSIHSETRANTHSAYDLTPEENRKVEEQERASVQQFGIVLSVGKNPVSGQVTRCGLGVGKPHGSIEIPKSGNAFLLPVRGNPYLFDLEADNPAADTPVAAARTSKPKAEPSNEAAMEAVPFPPGVLFTKNDTWADVVQTLAQKLPFALVSDAYTAARFAAYPPLQNGAAIAGDLDIMTAAQALDAICTAYNYLWWYEPGKNNAPGTLFFRSRAWFVEKRYETPASATAKAIAALEGVAKRWESMAVVDSVMGLTVEQLQGIAARRFASPYGRGPGFDFHPMISGGGGNAAFYWLRFWSRLTVEQKQMMKSPAGLPGKQLTEVQKNELLQNLFVSSSLQASPSEAAVQWEKARLHVWYDESQVDDFLPENAPQWKPSDLRPASLRFLIEGAEIGYGSSLALPVSLALPPQPKKAEPAKAP